MIFKIPSRPGLFDAQELEEIERGRPDGISSQEIISLFQVRGVKLSEATFRKYVQLGLLPTSHRVGRKGKHRGSRGVYPVSVVRRINLIKRMMDEDMTLEEIRDSFLSVHYEVERARIDLERLFSSIEKRAQRMRLRGELSMNVFRELEQAQKGARSLMDKIEKLSSRLAVVGSPSIPNEQGGLT